MEAVFLRNVGIFITHVTQQKAVLIIAVAVRTSNLTRHTEFTNSVTTRKQGSSRTSRNGNTYDTFNKIR
jgi:hypothetical protein